MSRLYGIGFSCLLAFQYVSKCCADSVPSGQASPTAPFPIPQNVTCTGCVLQARFRSTLTYPLSVEEVTTTVQVVPYVTIFPNTTVTSYSTLKPNVTAGINAAISEAFQSSLSTSLTWLWNGVILTYPTTYLAYDPSAITGAVPTKTTVDIVGPTCRAAPQHLPLTLPLEYSAFVVPDAGQDNGALGQYPLPQQLLHYLKNLPEVSKVYSGRDIQTCTQTVLATDIIHVPTHPTILVEPVPKTSVLFLTTSTANPIVRTVSTQPTLNIEESSATPVARIGNPVSKIDPSTGTPLVDLATDSPGSKPGDLGLLAAAIISKVSEQLPSSTIAAGNDGVHTGSGASIGDKISEQLPSAIIAAGSDGSRTGSGASVGSVGGTQAGLVQPATPGTTSPPSFPPTLTFSGLILTANSAGAFTIAGSTLTPGGPAATISGSTISLERTGSGATVAIINGVATTLPGSGAAGGLLTLDGTLFAPTTSAGSTFFVVDGSTLGVGQVVTVHGTTLSLGSNDGALVINGQTSFFAKSTAVQATAAQVFTGSADRSSISNAAWTVFGLVVIGSCLTWV